MLHRAVGCWGSSGEFYNMAHIQMKESSLGEAKYNEPIACPIQKISFRNSENITQSVPGINPVRSSRKFVYHIGSPRKAGCG